MDQLEAIPLPMAFPLWAIATVEIFRDELHALLGAPHFVDPQGNGLGIEHVWGFALKSTGQRLSVILSLPHGTDPRTFAGSALIDADPPDLEPILAAMGIARGDPRIRTFPPVPER